MLVSLPCLRSSLIVALCGNAMADVEGYFTYKKIGKLQLELLKQTKELTKKLRLKDEVKKSQEEGWTSVEQSLGMDVQETLANIERVTRKEHFVFAHSFQPSQRHLPLE